MPRLTAARYNQPTTPLTYPGASDAPQRHGTTVENPGLTNENSIATSPVDTQPKAPTLVGSKVSFKKHSRGTVRSILRGLCYALLAFWGLVALDGLLTRLPLHQRGTPAPGEEIGILHIHTNLNHGGGSPDEVMAAARDANLSFVAITDHNLAFDEKTLHTDPGNVLVVGGEEVSTPNGHFLALGAKPGWRDGVPYDTDAFLKRAGERGTIRVLAHPYNGSKSWDHWNTREFEGIEIWNDDAQWRRANPLQLAITLMMYPVNHELALVRLAGRPEPNLEKLDALLAERNVIATCGSDAHQAVPLGYGRLLRFPAYVTVFRISKQHVLLEAGDGNLAPRTTDAILDAIRKGHSFCAVDAVAPAAGFRNTVISGASVAILGDTALFDVAHPPTMQVQLPPTPGESRIKIYRDGKEVVSSAEKRLDWTVPSAGVYRTEVWLHQPGLTGWGAWLPWIIANPIHVQGQNPH
jgi:hypothetical protein